MIGLFPQPDNHDFFGTTTNAYEIFGTSLDIQGIASRHIESCVLLERMAGRKADDYVRLDVKMEDYYRIKDPEGGEAK